MPSIKKYKYIRNSEQRHSRVEELFSKGTAASGNWVTFKTGSIRPVSRGQTWGVKAEECLDYGPWENDRYPPPAVISFTAFRLLVVIIFQVQQGHPLPRGEATLPHCFITLQKGLF